MTHLKNASGKPACGGKLTPLDRLVAPRVASRMGKRARVCLSCKAALSARPSDRSPRTLLSWGHDVGIATAVLFAVEKEPLSVSEIGGLLGEHARELARCMTDVPTGAHLAPVSPDSLIPTGAWPNPREKLTLSRRGRRALVELSDLLTVSQVAAARLS